MGLDRRCFIKLAAGAGVGIMATPLPWTLIDDVSIWTQSWPWIPAIPNGETTYANTTSKLCPSACGLKVRMAGGKPIRAQSDPEHPLGGGISALAAAEVQLLYSPARVKAPLIRKGDGAYVQITWDEANRLLADKLASAGNRLACISGDETGSSIEVLSAFLSSRGSDDMFLMPSEAQAASRAWELMGGIGQIAYDIEGSDFILALGANYLESWGTFIRNRKAFATVHPHGLAPESAMVYVGPVQNNTAAVADAWVPAKVGTETVLALGLANALINRGRSISAPDFEDFRVMAATYTPAKVEALTGVSPEALRNMLEGLLKAKTPLVLVGSELGHGGGAAPVMAGMAVNLLLGGFGRKGGVKAIPLAKAQLAGAKNRTEVYRKDVVSYLSSKPTAQMLLVYSANPAYALPNPKGAAEVLKTIPFKVSFSAFLDETAKLCELVLPMPLGLETFDDIESPYGCGKAFYALTRPVTKPVVKAQHGLDLLLAASASLGGKLPKSFEDVLKAKASAVGTAFASLVDGKAFQNAAVLPLPTLNLNPDLLNRAADRKPLGAVLTLAPLRKIAMGTAQTGIPPFNVKTIRTSELVAGDMHVLINGATASSLGLKPGDKIRLSSGQNEIMARVQIFEGVAPDTVAVQTGFGHTALDQFSQKKGANAAELLISSEEPGTGLTVWNRLGASIVKA